MKLTEYIEKYYDGNKSAFARANEVLPQQVNNWINGDYVVVNNVLCSPRRDLAPIELKK